MEKKKQRPRILSNSEIIVMLDQSQQESQEGQLSESEIVGPEPNESIVFDLDEVLSCSSTNNIEEIPMASSDSTTQSSEPEVDLFDQNYDPDCEIQQIDFENSDLTEISTCRPSVNAASFRHIIKKTGRIKDGVWNEFDMVEVSKSQTKAICKKCGFCVPWAKVERLKGHLEKCTNVLQTKATNPVTPKKKKVQWDIPSLAEQIKQQTQEIDAQVARFIYASNIPFSTVEKTEFSKLMKLLKPSYKLPSEEIIGGRLLDHVYKEVTDASKLNTKGKLATLMQDGWTATQSSPVISHCLSVECNRVQFLNAIPCTNSEKTSEYCLELLQDAIKITEEKYDCKVFSVVTDNTNGMILMRKLLAREHPDVCTYGCHTHLLNLIGKKVVDSDAVDKVVKVQNFFRNHTYPRETLKKLKALTPVLPAATRWNSQCDSLKNYLTNHSIYIEIAKHERSKTPKLIMDTLMDYSLYKTIEVTLENLKPISEAVVKLQHERASLAYSIRFWINILKSCKIPESYKIRFNEIVDLAMTEIACAAYLIHPKYKGEELPEAYLKRGFLFLEKKSPQFVVVAIKLKQKDSTYFPSTFLNKELFEGSCQLQPEQWWREVDQQMNDVLPSGFIQLAEKLMLLPASSSGIERIFSTMGSIMVDTRSRLGIEKAAKLCMIHRALNESRDT